MQQTGLNLIAIAVFLMTLSVLLGPLVNISSAIPAIITFGVLGLITVDTLSWENKGVTLLLDIFASAEQKQRVVHHEAGHFLAAYLLGIPVTDYTLTAWEAFRKGYPGLGGVVFELDGVEDKLRSPQAMSLILERLCTVLMAGVAAENLVYEQSQGGNEDRQKIRLLCQNAGLPESVWGQKESWGQLQAKNLLTKYKNVYEALVVAMEKRTSVRDCYQLVQQKIDNN